MADIIFLSPNHRSDTFPANPGIEDLISLFEDRVNGWQLGIAQQLLGVQHSGFAVLLVTTAYFEMIARFTRGDVGTGRKDRAFYNGLSDVFPQFTDTAERILWNDLRGSLYHRGITGPRILLTEQFPEPIVLDQLNATEVVRINPQSFVFAVSNHFQQYVSRLRDPGERMLRVNFMRVFSPSAEAIQTKRLLGRTLDRLE